MMGGRHIAVLLLLLAVCQARSPVFDDDDEDTGSGRSDQHVATVPLEHSFGVSAHARPMMHPLHAAMRSMLHACSSALGSVARPSVRQRACCWHLAQMMTVCH